MDALVGKNYSKRREFKYCARKFATYQDRLAKMEAYVTHLQSVQITPEIQENIRDYLLQSHF